MCKPSCGKRAWYFGGTDPPTWLDCKEWEEPVHPEGNQPWIFTGRTVAEAVAPILWPPDLKS